MMPILILNILATGMIAQKHIFHQEMDSVPTLIEPLHNLAHSDLLNSQPKPTFNTESAPLTPASLTRTISRKLPSVPCKPLTNTHLPNSCGPLITKSRPSGITSVHGILDGLTPPPFQLTTNCNITTQLDKPNT